MNVINLRDVKGFGTLILISFPHQVLHAFSALAYNRMQTGISQNAPIFLLFWSYEAKNHKNNSDFIKTFRMILRNFSNVTLVVPTFFERLFFLSPYCSIRRRSLWIKKSMNYCNFNTFLYSHDISADHTAQVLMQSFENITRICFGDTPGFLYEDKKIEESYRAKGNFFKRLFNNYINSNLKKIYFSSKSIISIFLDQDLSISNIELIPKRIVLEIFSKMKILKDKKFLSSVNENFSKSTNKNLYMVISSNFSRSKLMKKNQEINFYAEVITINIPPNSEVMFRLHSGMQKKILHDLEKRLPNYHFRLFPPILYNMPIELIIDIIKDIKIISVSSSTLMISYLSGKNVIHRLNDSLIYKYFKSNCIDHVDYNNKKIIKALQYLDEKSSRKASF